MRIFTITLLFVLNSLLVFGESLHSTIANFDTTIFASQYIISDTIDLDQNYSINLNQQIQLMNPNDSLIYTSIEIDSVTIPAGWQMEYCQYYTSSMLHDCSENTEIPIEPFSSDYMQLEYYAIHNAIPSSEPIIYHFSIADVDLPCKQQIEFRTYFDFSDIPVPATGFTVAQNTSNETYTSYSSNDYIYINNNIEIYNENNEMVQIGWKVLNQYIPEAWDIASYSSFVNNTFFLEEPMAVEGTETLYPNSFTYIGMSTELQAHNGTPGTRSLEVLIYDLNDSLNYNEILTFNANVQLGESGDGIMIFNTESTEYSMPYSADEPTHFHHIPTEMANNNLFEEAVLAWEVITYDKPAEWVMEDELILLSSVDYGNYPNLELSLSGTLNMTGGDYGMLEYFIHDVQHNNVSGTAHLEVLVYDTQDSAATATVLSFISILELPETGTGFSIFEDYSGSVHYLQDPNEELFMYLSPIYVANSSEDIVELAWEKISQTIPAEWDVQYDFNAYQSYYNTEVPDGGEFNLFAYEEAYFGLNYNNVQTNGVAGFAELQLRVYDRNDSLNYNQIITFRSSVCIEDANAALITPLTQTSFCAGETITLESIAGLQNLQWSTGQTTPSITIPVQEYISLSAEDANGCPQNQDLYFDIETPYEEGVCIVSVDESTGKNVVVWEKTPNQGTAFYNIYKETQIANDYTLVATQEFDKLSEFIDDASNPIEASNRYKIAAVNDCGAESPLSTPHKTLHLTINVSNNSNVNLIWASYEGFDYPTFNILRGNAPNNMQLIAQRPSNTFTYTDIAPPSGDLYYAIEVEFAGGCDPSKVLTSTRSNLVNNNMVATTTTLDHNIEVFPNPFDTDLHIQNIPSDVTNLRLTDISGKVLVQQVVQAAATSVATEDIPSGMYFVELVGAQIYVVKVVK